jgi:hypothetical protein
MKTTGPTSRTVAVERVFAPGRLRRQRMAAAYERLLPIRRIARCQEFKVNGNLIQEGQRCAL